MTAVIIVSYGRVKLMRRTLETLQASDRKDVTITVVDNGSQLEMMSLLAGYRGLIDHLLLLSKNKGKPYAWNVGATITREKCIADDTKAPTHYLFCDNDLDFKPDWHTKLKTAYEEHRDLPLCILSGCAFSRHPLSVKTGPTTQINIVRFPMGCCMFMSADAYVKNGPWDTRRLIRTVDTSYCRNSQARGWVNAAIHPDSVIGHTGGKARTWHIQTGKPKQLLP